MLSTSLSWSSSLMHRIARNPAAGARGPAGGAGWLVGWLVWAKSMEFRSLTAHAADPNSNLVITFAHQGNFQF